MTFIKSINDDSNKIVLKKYRPPSPELLITDQKNITIAFVDTETTGIDRANDQIIEIAIKLLKFEEISGKLLTIEGSYESLNDPEEDISKEITLLTGINNNMVEGKHIDWNQVNKLLEDADLIVAHNAAFDRAFLDKCSNISTNKIWACSVFDIDWLSRGFSSAKQELLCYWHGFYFDAHRAMNDVDALIHLLTYDLENYDRALLELIESSKRPEYVIFADNFKFDPVKKDIVKGNKYRWDSKSKVWFKKVNVDELANEKDWLTATIYSQIFEGRIEEIDPIDKYKL
ncbi:MAG: 3'-5' exonuclease [Candidatus Neomarinimicrobiota bacterium]